MGAQRQVLEEPGGRIQPADPKRGQRHPNGHVVLLPKDGQDGPRGVGPAHHGRHAQGPTCRACTNVRSTKSEVRAERHGGHRRQDGVTYRLASLAPTRPCPSPVASCSSNNKSCSSCRSLGRPCRPCCRWCHRQCCQEAGLLAEGSGSQALSQGPVSNCVSKLPARSTSWAVVPLLQVLWLPPSAQVVRSGASSPSKHWSNSSATGTCLVPRWTSSSPTTSAIQSGSRVKNWLRSKTIPMSSGASSRSISRSVSRTLSRNRRNTSVARRFTSITRSTCRSTKRAARSSRAGSRRGRVSSVACNQQEVF